MASRAAAERLQLLQSIVEVYKKRSEDIAAAVSREMGAPRPVRARAAQAGIGVAHLEKMIEVLKTFEFEKCTGTSGDRQGADRRRAA